MFTESLVSMLNRNFVGINPVQSFQPSPQAAANEETTKNELDKATHEIKKLKEDMEKSDISISQLRSNVQKVENQNDLLKKEISIKNEQLKGKNNKIGTLEKNLDKINEEKDLSNNNITNKIIKWKKECLPY